jgi:hypothetical protein
MRPCLQILQHLRAAEDGERAGTGTQQPRHKQVSEWGSAAGKRDVPGKRFRGFYIAAAARPPLVTHNVFVTLVLQRHLEIADVPGKFVAHTNLGLVEAAAGNYSAAAVNHRLALRCAIILRSIEGEALACGNLGVASRCAVFAPKTSCCITPRHSPRNIGLPLQCWW